MKDLTTLFLILGGVVAAPFVVDGMHEFLGAGEIEWMPFFLALFIGTMLVLLPVTRPVGTGLIIGTVVFGGLLAYRPDFLTWLPYSVDPKPPF